MSKGWVVVAGLIVPLSCVAEVRAAGDEPSADESSRPASEEADEDEDRKPPAGEDDLEEVEAEEEVEPRADDDEPALDQAAREQREAPGEAGDGHHGGWQSSPAELPPEDPDSEDHLRPSTRPGTFTFDAGPSILMLACLEDDCIDVSITQVKLTQVNGRHLGDDGEGVGLGLGLSEAFGKGVVRIQPGLRLWGDIAVSDELGVYIVPHAHVGYAVWAPTQGIGDPVHMFNFATGVGLKAVFADRLSASFQPLGLDLAVGAVRDRPVTYLWYDLAFGLGATF